MRRVMIIPLRVCLLLCAFPAAFAQEAQPGKSEEDNGYAQISIFAKALELIRQDYVDDNKTSYHDLVTAAMKGMLSSLDPHSQFMDPNDFRDMQDDTRSRFNGLGIEVSMKNGLPTVITAMEDTPAAKAGILSGDQILRINGISTEKMDLQDAITVLRGPAGAKVTLTLLRPLTKEIKEYTLQRAEIKIQSVKGARLLDFGREKRASQLSDGVAGQRRQCKRRGNRRRSAQGFASCCACWRDHVRKGFRTECDAVAGRLCGAFDHRKILYAEQTGYSGQWRN